MTLVNTFVSLCNTCLGPPSLNNVNITKKAKVVTIQWSFNPPHLFDAELKYRVELIAADKQLSRTKEGNIEMTDGFQVVQIGNVQYNHCSLKISVINRFGKQSCYERESILGKCNSILLT